MSRLRRCFAMRPADLPRQPDGETLPKAELGPDALPRWDLTDLYASPDSPALAADLARERERAQAFNATYRGKLAQLDAAGTAWALAGYETIEEGLGRIMSYAQLLFSGDSSDPVIAQFYQSMGERVPEIRTELLFFTRELNRRDETVIRARMAEPALAPWASWIEDLRVFQPHQLS